MLRNRWALGGIAAGVSLAAAGAGFAIFSNSRADDPQSTFTNAVANGKQAEDDPAAIVNGVVIPKSELAQVRTQLLTFLANGIDAASTTSVLNYMVRSELIAQEAKTART